MSPHLPGVIDQESLPGRVVRSVERFQVGVERCLGVDDHAFAAGESDDDVGTHAAIGIVGAVDRLLMLEVTVLQHAGELDDAFQLQLAPAAADARPLEGIHQPPGLASQVLAGRIERCDPLQQLRTGLEAPPLRLLDLAIDLVQRLRDRCEEVLHRLFAGVDVGRRLRAGLAQSGFSQIEKRPIIGFQRLGGQGLEGFTQGSFGFVVRPEPLGMHGAVFFELAPELRLRGTAGQPADQHAEGQTNAKCDDQCDGFDGH